LHICNNIIDINPGVLTNMSQKDYINLIKLSEQLFFHPHEITDFISEDELQTCIDIYDELPIFEPASHERATRKDYLMYSETDKRIYNIFMPKLQAIFPDKQITIDGGNFTTWHKPVTMHTDGFQFEYKDLDSVVDNQQILGCAVLVPLKTDTGKGTPNTVFFEQTYIGKSLNYASDSERMYSGLDINNFTHREFDANDKNYDLISHIPLDKLSGYSIEKVMPWNFGSAIIWHRSQFHCASVFNGFNNKLHLLFFVNFV
jgi:hypothetical protein